MRTNLLCISGTKKEPGDIQSRTTKRPRPLRPFYIGPCAHGGVRNTTNSNKNPTSHSNIRRNYLAIIVTVARTLDTSSFVAIIVIIWSPKVIETWNDDCYSSSRNPALGDAIFNSGSPQQATTTDNNKQLLRPTTTTEIIWRAINVTARRSQSRRRMRPDNNNGDVESALPSSARTVGIPVARQTYVEQKRPKK